MEQPHTLLLRQFFVGDEADLTAFKEAGDELVDFIARGEKYRWYEDFLRPIGLLYRHYLELELKYWINELSGHFKTKRKSLFTVLISLVRRIFSQCPTRRTFDEPDKVLKGHSLKNLWLKLRPLIQPLCVSQEDNQILRDAERVIMIFHKYDPTGQEFRYTRTTKDTETLRNLPPRIDVKEVKRLIGRVSFFFDGLGGVVSV